MAETDQFYPSENTVPAKPDNRIDRRTFIKHGLAAAAGTTLTLSLKNSAEAQPEEIRKAPVDQIELMRLGNTVVMNECPKEPPRIPENVLRYGMDIVKEFHLHDSTNPVQIKIRSTFDTCFIATAYYNAPIRMMAYSNWEDGESVIVLSNQPMRVDTLCQELGHKIDPMNNSQFAKKNPEIAEKIDREFFEQLTRCAKTLPPVKNKQWKTEPFFSQYEEDVFTYGMKAIGMKVKDTFVAALPKDIQQLICMGSGEINESAIKMMHEQCSPDMWQRQAADWILDQYAKQQTERDSHESPKLRDRELGMFMTQMIIENPEAVKKLFPDNNKTIFSDFSRTQYGCRGEGFAELFLASRLSPAEAKIIYPPSLLQTLQQLEKRYRSG